MEGWRGREKRGGGEVNKEAWRDGEGGRDGEGRREGGKERKGERNRDDTMS